MMTIPTVVYAIHNFEAENEDEINFLVGEPITVLEKDEKYLDGWWQGRNINGETGLFPMNYTSPEKPHISNSRSNSSTATTVEEEEYDDDEEEDNRRRQKGIEQWDVDQVADWLKSVGLASVAIHFIDQEITGDILLDLNIEALKELGINTFGKRYKVMQAINTLKGDKPTPNTSVSTSAIRPPTTHKASIRRSNSQSDAANGGGLYQFPRKAPLPPHRPLSPTSMSSSAGSMNRSNTVSSSGTSESIRKIKIDYPSSTLSSTTTQHTGTSSTSSSQSTKPDWSDTSSAIHPLMNPMQISKTHTLSVSSFAEDTHQPSNAFQACEHEGWLHKQSDKYKTWNKRWFVLKGTNLFYFKSPKDVRMKGIINLRGYKIIVDESIHAGKYCFKAQHERERTFFFYTDTEEAMRVWIKMLIKTMIARDFRAPVMSSNHMATVSLDVARRMRPRPPSVIMYNKNQVQSQPSQTVSSEMTMLEEEEDEDIIPPPSSPPLPPLSPAIKMEEEEEDLIDPQHQSLPPEPETHQDVYLNWINCHLPANKQVIDLASAFRNGDTLILLLEAISGKQVRRPPQQKGGSVSVMMLDNIVAAFKFMGREGVQVDGQYTIKDVFSGDEDKIMTMLDAIRDWAEQGKQRKEEEKTKNHGVWIDKENGGWRGSAMMDQRYNYDQY